MAALLAPGGRFYMAEFHPITDVFADDGLQIARSYFDRTPQTYDEPGTYADPDARTVHNRSVEWTHGLGDVVSALASPGCASSSSTSTTSRCTRASRFWSGATTGPITCPSGMPSLPLMYSLRASRR